MIIFGCIYMFAGTVCAYICTSYMFAGTVCADICTSVPDSLLFRLPLS